MELTTFIVEVYCLIDDWLRTQPRARQRGPEPLLADSEVLTMEVVGEYLGIDTDRGIYTYFRRHFADWFPALGRVHRTTFIRQAANLWVAKERLWRELSGRVEHDPAVALLDSFPVPVCRFARAYRCRLFAGLAAYGYDEMAKQTYYGLRGHLRVCWPGVIAEASLAPANTHDLVVAEADLLEGTYGWALGDRNYHSPQVRERLAERGLELLTPPKQVREGQWPRWLVHKRRLIETVIGQLVERYRIKRVWARDTWHLCSRFLRKLLSHTLAVLLCQRQGLSPLRLAQLVTL
jgi:hypothetical protein